MTYFDFENVAHQAHISDAHLQQLKELMRREFPTDEMMYELHVLRACMAIRDGRITLEDTLRDRSAVSSGDG